MTVAELIGALSKIPDKSLEVEIYLPQLQTTVCTDEVHLYKKGYKFYNASRSSAVVLITASE